MSVTYYLCSNCGRKVSGREDICICQELATLRAKLAQVEQDRDRLTAERDQYKEWADAAATARDNTLKALWAAQEGNKRLKAEVEKWQKLHDVNCSNLAEIGHNNAKCAETLLSQLTAAQQSAQEQFRDVAVEFFYWWHNQPGSNTAQGFDEWWKLRAELSKGEGK